MSDCKSNLIRELEASLADSMPKETISMVSDALMKALREYTVERIVTDLVPYDDQNERILKQYCACLFVDGKSKGTIYQYRRTCQRLADSLGKRFTEMGSYDIRYFLACEKDRGVSGRSCENLRSNISAFFQWMAVEEIIAKNPCAAIKPIKYVDQVRKPFADVEIDALRGACQTKKERAIVEVLLSTGIRVSELSGLDQADVDTHSLTVHVRHGKGDKERITYITNVALKHLAAYWNDRAENGVAAFYNGKHGRLNAGGVRHILNCLAERAAVENVHPHRFRRTFATGLAARRMDIQDIQALLGHSSINTTMEYVYTSELKTKASYQKHIA